MHLLKWQFQTAGRGASWEKTIKVQRRSLARHFKDNPSLIAMANEAILDAYGDARFEAALETGMPETAFPADCPWTLAQIGDADFWPA